MDELSLIKRVVFDVCCIDGFNFRESVDKHSSNRPIYVCSQVNIWICRFVHVSRFPSSYKALLNISVTMPLFILENLPLRFIMLDLFKYYFFLF